MRVTADASRLLTRLRKFSRELPIIADAALIAGAYSVLGSIRSNIRSSWVDHNQVGFDLENFLSIIDNVEAIDGGGVGILNVNRMGTHSDLEKIRGIPGLWHQGTGQGEKFGLFVNQTGMFFDHVTALEANRRQRWGNVEPQWWLIEHGTLGSGAYAPRGPKSTITNTVLGTTTRTYNLVSTVVTRMLKQHGIIV